LSKQEFEREVRRRYKIKDSGLVDALWEKHGVEYDFDDDPKLREEMFGDIDEKIPFYALGRHRERTERKRKQITIQPPGGDYEVTRAKAVSEYLAKVAVSSTDTETSRYRDHVLGRTLAAAEARRFLSSPVAAIVPARIRPRAKPQGVSYLDYELEEQTEDESGPYRMLRYSYAGRDLETRLRPLLQVPGRANFMVYAGDAISPDEWWQQIPGQNDSALLLPTRFGHSVVAKSNSALDLLMKQANRLVHKYLLEPTEAAWLILTGEPPNPKYMSARLSSLSTDDLSRAVLTLTVEPWVSPDKVKSYYQEIRQSILHDAGCKHRTVEVFRFVVAHTEVEETTLEKTPQWSHLCDLWNAEHPEDPGKRFSDYRDFRRSYIRGRDAIAFPISE
jgi:hypothetical protein